MEAVVLASVTTKTNVNVLMDITSKDPITLVRDALTLDVLSASKKINVFHALYITTSILTEDALSAVITAINVGPRPA